MTRIVTTKMVIDRKNRSTVETGRTNCGSFLFNLSREEIRSDYLHRSVDRVFFFATTSVLIHIRCAFPLIVLHADRSRYFFEHTKFVGRRHSRGRRRDPVAYTPNTGEKTTGGYVHIIYFNRFYYSPSRRKFTVLA